MSDTDTRGGYSTTCKACSWESPIRETVGLAIADLRRHEDERHPMS